MSRNEAREMKDDGMVISLVSSVNKRSTTDLASCEPLLKRTHLASTSSITRPAPALLHPSLLLA
jgi:hypothetical protein